MPIRRSLIFFTILTLAIPIAYFGRQSFAPQGAAPGGETRGRGNEPSYEFHAVGTGDVFAVVSAVGEIEADETVDISFTSAGRVSDVFVQESDYVLAGDILITLEGENERIAYDEAVLDLELAEIRFADLSGPVDADEIRIAEANVDAAFGNYRGSLNSTSPGAIQAAELEIARAQSQIETAQERRLLGGEFDNQEQIDLADAQIGEATFNYEIAQLQLEDLRTGDSAAANAAYLGYLQAQAELEEVLAGPTNIELEQAQVRVEQAEARLERTEEALDKVQLRAPFDGYVTAVNVEPGTLVSPGVGVAQMVDVEPLRVTVEVDEIDIGQIEPGMPATIEVDALPNVLLPARLAKLALVGTQTQGGIVNYDAEIELETVDPVVRVGMTAEANIIVSQQSDVLRVPNAYIRLDRRTNEAFAEVLNTETQEFEEVSVALGLRGEDFSEVVSGLNEGDIVRADLSGNQFELFGG